MMRSQLEKRAELLQVATQMMAALIPYQMKYEWSPEDLVEMAVDDARRLIAVVDDYTT
jgi:hypothetical protein